MHCQDDKIGDITLPMILDMLWNRENTPSLSICLSGFDLAVSLRVLPKNPRLYRDTTVCSLNQCGTINNSSQANGWTSNTHRGPTLLTDRAGHLT